MQRVFHTATPPPSGMLTAGNILSTATSPEPPPGWRKQWQRASSRNKRNQCRGDALVPPADAPVHGSPRMWFRSRKTSTASPRRRRTIPAIVSPQRVLVPHGPRIARFFPEEELDAAVRRAYPDDNIKVSEFLYPRVDLADVAGVWPAKRAPVIGSGRSIAGTKTRFVSGRSRELRRDAPRVVRGLAPDFEEEYARRGRRLVSGVSCRCQRRHAARSACSRTIISIR